MAIIKCPECGKEISDKSDRCIGCGFPIGFQCEKKEYEVKKETRSLGRLGIGILYVVISPFLLLQSCAAGTVNALEQNNSGDGMLGVFTALVFIVIGIMALCTTKTKSKKFLTIVCFFLFIYGTAIAMFYNGIFSDLKFYGWLMWIGALVFAFGYKKLKSVGK